MTFRPTTPWDRLRPLRWPYVRIPDDEHVRMCRCTVDGAEIPTLGVGYHERGNAHREKFPEAVRRRQRAYDAKMAEEARAKEMAKFTCPRCGEQTFTVGAAGKSTRKHKGTWEVECADGVAPEEVA